MTKAVNRCENCNGTGLGGEGGFDYQGPPCCKCGGHGIARDPRFRHSIDDVLRPANCRACGSEARHLMIPNWICFDCDTQLKILRGFGVPTKFDSVIEMEEASFVTTAIRSYDDDSPRLVFADWLDEHGRPEEAAKLRELL